MSLVDEVMKRVRRELRRFDNMVEFVTDIVAADNGTVECQGAKVDDADKGHPIDAAVLWQLGFYSRPLDGASGVVLKSSGKGGVSFLVGWRNRKYEIALQKGEVAMANEAGAVVKLDKNGKISATAKAGQIVAINGGDWSAPQWEQFIVALKAFLSTMSTVTNATASVAATAANNFTNALATGNLGAAATDFKSPNAKWG